MLYPTLLIGYLWRGVAAYPYGGCLAASQLDLMLQNNVMLFFPATFHCSWPNHAQIVPVYYMNSDREYLNLQSTFFCGQCHVSWQLHILAGFAFHCLISKARCQNWRHNIFIPVSISAKYQNVNPFCWQNAWSVCVCVFTCYCALMCAVSLNEVFKKTKQSFDRQTENVFRQQPDRSSSQWVVEKVVLVSHPSSSLKIIKISFLRVYVGLRERHSHIIPTAVLRARKVY